MTKKDKIKQILNIISEYGSFCMSDIFNVGEEIENILLLSNDDFNNESN